MQLRRRMEREVDSIEERLQLLLARTFVLRYSTLTLLRPVFTQCLHVGPFTMSDIKPSP